MRKRLLVPAITIVLLLGIYASLASVVLAQCGCSCAWMCGQDRCEYACSECSLTQEITVAFACCRQAKTDTPCGLE